MKQLKTEFEGTGQVKGYNFSQIKATDNAFMYEVSSNNTIHYEVFKRKENRRYDCISYPSDKSFGVWAWTCINLERAEEKFKYIDVVKVKNK